jgi:lipopolysaccharide export system permease protein
MGPHYFYRSIWFFDRTAGLLMLTAAMFTVTWIQRHQELTALMAAGVSRVRVVVPVIASVVVISLLAALNRELVIPKFREQLAIQPRDMAGSVGRELKPRYDNETDILLRGAATFVDQQRIERPDFLLPPSLDQYGNRLVAQEAIYLPPEGGRPGGYLLRGVEEPQGLDARPSLTLAGRPVLITAGDAPAWLQPGQCFVVSNVDVSQLTGGSAWRQFSSTAELIRGLRNRSLDFGADVRVAVHARFVQPLLDVTLLFLGLPMVLTRENRNVFMAIGLCALVTSAFVLVAIAFQYLGSIYAISPVLAAWAPLMIFVPVAVAMADAMWE